jgi:hypothetical protein
MTTQTMMRTGTTALSLVRSLGCVAALSLVSSIVWADDVARLVTVREVPDGGIQPQAVIDGSGVIHLVYFKGDPGAGDLFYVRLAPGEARFSPPIRVNSQPGSAVATGTIRGGQLAVGKGGRVHVAWNGSSAAKPKNPISGSPMLYTRSNAERTAFEPERNLMQQTSALDGGGTVAADGLGNVYVAWHGKAAGAPDGEMGRRLWVARSQDEGATFETEAPAIATETGACACCGARAFADSKGTLYILYRAATGGVERDMYLVASRDHGQQFQGASIHPWTYNACPMSSESMTESRSGVLAAWETKGEVYFGPIEPSSLKVSSPITPPGGHGNRKHPALAVNRKAQGETILVWTEGTGWQKGGSLVWQVFDSAGRPVGDQGRIEGGVPVWGLAAVVALPDGGFTIIH